ncbi:hypothetical protein SEA_GODONK_48 [Gordonia phage GodonK]|uniref:Uncharacterized protein n=1 Tax=Gordonia phage GodonK TaxID=2562192 RepID=A0A4D6E222_9CAUD|nr:antitoxin from a toxin-antitoxin system [Gordonia phage GodonK]QBZ72667.1 hypothetical protein SEA_GODONK_48 [Gordonia phage GodonK]
MPVMNIAGVNVTLTVDELLDYQNRVSAQARLDRNPKAKAAIVEGDKDESNPVLIDNDALSRVVKHHKGPGRPKSDKSHVPHWKQRLSQLKAAGYRMPSNAQTTARLLAQFVNQYKVTDVPVPSDPEHAFNWLIDDLSHRSIFNTLTVFVDRVGKNDDERLWNSAAMTAALYIAAQRHGRDAVAVLITALENTESPLRKVVDRENKDYYSKTVTHGNRRFGDDADRLALVWLLTEHMDEVIEAAAKL